MTPSKALCPTKRTRTCFSLALMIDKGSLNAAKLWWRSVDFYINFKTPQNWGQNTEPRCTTCSGNSANWLFRLFKMTEVFGSAQVRAETAVPVAVVPSINQVQRKYSQKKERSQAQQNGQTIEESSEDRNKSTSMPKCSTALIFMLLIAIIFSMNNLYMSLTNISFIPQPSYAHNNPFTLF